MTTAVNPKVIDIDTVELVKCAVSASFTGVCGVCVCLNSAGQVALTADAKTPYGCLAETISTARTQGADVWIYRYNIGTRLEINTASGAASAAVGVANKGIAYDVQLIGTGTSAITYLDLAAPGTWAKVIDLSAEYEPTKNATADDPGKCVVEIQIVQTAAAGA